MWPYDIPDDEIPKTTLTPVTEPVAVATRGSLPVRTVQEGLAAHFGARAMAHSCGTGTCDGRWGPGTERQLDLAFDAMGLGMVTFEVKGGHVVMPMQAVTWLRQKAASYTPTATRPAGAPPPADIVPEPYASPRRTGGMSPWIYVGGATAVVGLGALGYVMWRNRKGGKR